MGSGGEFAEYFQLQTDFKINNKNTKLTRHFLYTLLGNRLYNTKYYEKHPFTKRNK
jgi:hypothetical protein